MTPSVGGITKLRVSGLLVLSGAATGAIVGFAAGVAWTVSPLPPLDGATVVTAAWVAVLLDVIHRSTGRLRPPAVGRQVPQEWSRVFDPSVVAVLYGSRLGVGPLTVLSSWLWWAAFVASSAGGPAVGAAAGAVFAIARTAVMLGVAEWARRAMAGNMARVRRGEAAAHAACILGAVVLAVGLTLR